MGDTPNSQEPGGGDFINSVQAHRSGSNPYEEHNSAVNAHGDAHSSPQQGHYPYASSNQQPQLQHQSSHARQDAFSMTSIQDSLTYQNYSNAPQQRYTSVTAPSMQAYQLPNLQQYGIQGQAAISYNYPYQPQYQPNYPPNHAPPQQQFQPRTTPGGQFYQGQGFVAQQSPYFIQPNQYLPQAQLSERGAQFGGRGGPPGDGRTQPQQRSNDYSGGGGPGRPGSTASSSGISSVVRGPPRKPRQSGHAIWIGNLPPQTDLMSLVFHVCKETNGLESLFLISKSNCAFANFKDEATCSAAQGKIHDSRFQTVRLVSRLRRSSVGAAAGVSVPTGPAALNPPSNTTVTRTPSPEDESNPKSKGADPNDGQENDDSASPKDKFFVVKSLTVEDLELSVRNGIWATQSHNEDALNQAYDNADNVYLIFSANKSGEYFGYARMISPINDDPAAAIEFAPKAQSTEDPEVPKAIPTPATEFAPKGRIIDDSARGTIFWEVERDNADDGDEIDEEDELQSQSDANEPSTPSKAWGKPFKIEWVSTTRLPFYRTRGLRNPWNSNREVKIARDGTELETTIGRRLLGLFHRVPSPTQVEMPIQIMGTGYPQMRPFS